MSPTAPACGPELHGLPSPEHRSRSTFGRSPVRESRTPGSVRGAGRNPCPYRDSRERINWDADAVVISGRRNGGARHRERMSGPAWSKTLACMQAPRPETGRPPALAARELSGPHREGEEPKPLTRGAVQTLHLT